MHPVIYGAYTAFWTEELEIPLKNALYWNYKTQSTKIFPTPARNQEHSTT
jgi:hypothetical protein